MVRAKNADPLLAHEIQPTQVLAELVRADERLRKDCPLITLPVLILLTDIIRWVDARIPAAAVT